MRNGFAARELAEPPRPLETSGRGLLLLTTLLGLEKPEYNLLSIIIYSKLAEFSEYEFLSLCY